MATPEKYTDLLVTIDTEFSSLWNRKFAKDSDEAYEFLKLNVGPAKCTQVGIVFSKENGELPIVKGVPSYFEFNLKFNQYIDPCKEDAMDMHRRANIDLNALADGGISAEKFAADMDKVGLFMAGRFTVVTFYGGLDMAHILKITGNPLPPTRLEFKALVNKFFGRNTYDVKILCKMCGYYGSLKDMAKKNEIKWLARYHTAGDDAYVTDAYVTLQLFLKLKESCTLKLAVNKLYDLYEETE